MSYSVKLLTIVFLFWCSVPVFAAGIGGEKGNSRHIIYDKTYDLLVKNKYCKDKRSCPQQGIISVDATLDGLMVSTYGIADQTVLNSIKDIVYIEYRKNSGSFSICFRAHKETWEERHEIGFIRNIWYRMFNKPLMEIKLERIEK